LIEQDKPAKEGSVHIVSQPVVSGATIIKRKASSSSANSVFASKLFDTSTDNERNELMLPELSGVTTVVESNRLKYRRADPSREDSNEEVSIPIRQSEQFVLT